MSVVTTVTFPVDPAAFAAAVKERAAEFAAVSANAKSLGCLRHRFVVGDGVVLAVDEWESAEAFEGFFAAETRIPPLMQAAGVTGPPEVSVYAELDTPDAF